MDNIKRYRPSNGSEGDRFMAEFCEHCAKSTPDGLGCEITDRSMVFDEDDPRYPKEWRWIEGVSHKRGIGYWKGTETAICTAFKKEKSSGNPERE